MTALFFRDLELKIGFSFFRIEKRFGDFLVQTKRKSIQKYRFFTNTRPRIQYKKEKGKPEAGPGSRSRNAGGLFPVRGFSLIFPTPRTREKGKKVTFL